MIFIVISCALLLDQLLGETRRFHPLVGFGNCARWIEQRLNRQPSSNNAVLKGLLALIVLLVPWVGAIVIVAYYFEGQAWQNYQWLMDSLVLYWAIGLKSLQQHIKPIQRSLQSNQTELARRFLSSIVSRDTDKLSAQQITAATIETTLENGNDALFGALFWYLVGGLPMVICYRLVNTLDAMWGYRNERYEQFGKVAAKFDDILNYIPARLTAITYGVCGNFRLAIYCWQTSAKLLASPNAGPVMAAGAGSLDLRLGGPTYYHQRLIQKPFFGSKIDPEIQDIERAIKLVINSTLTWIGVLFMIAIFDSFTIEGS